jgi:hypothetical protein
MKPMANLNKYNEPVADPPQPPIIIMVALFSVALSMDLNGSNLQ